MSAPVRNTLPKAERLSGKTGISALISGGRWGTTAHFRYCWKQGDGTGANRIMVSVSKKYFKRAVKRNLLKRRTREAYRTNKTVLPEAGIDCLFAYSSKETADFSTICTEVCAILSRIGKSLQQ